jgi:hypothetical protein
MVWRVNAVGGSDGGDGEQMETRMDKTGRDSKVGFFKRCYPKGSSDRDSLAKISRPAERFSSSGAGV